MCICRYLRRIWRCMRQAVGIWRCWGEGNKAVGICRYPRRIWWCMRQAEARSGYLEVLVVSEASSVYLEVHETDLVV